MDFFRSEKGYARLSVDDSLEVFCDILKGSSDITPELLYELCDRYCLPQLGKLIVGAPKLRAAVRSAVATYQDRLSLLDEEREWRDDDEYEDMKAHYAALLDEAKAALKASGADRDWCFVFHAGRTREIEIEQHWYAAGRLAVQLHSDDEPYATLSVNIPEIELAIGEFVAKTYSENEGLLEALVAAGKVQIIRRVSHALGELPVCRLIG
jgi:hypothetical protein